MKIPCVLVTGVGAIIGQGIIKSLRMVDRPVRIIGLDMKLDAFGARYCDAFYAKPDDESGEAYLHFFKELIATEHIELILPGIEHDVFFFDAHRSFFESLNTIPVLNQHHLIEIARDKWKTARALLDANLQTIPGVIPQNWQQCVAELGSPPLLLKPRFGNGSRGIVRLYEPRDYDFWVENDSDTVMIQKIVGTDEDEYTAAVFGFGDGEASAPIIFRRKLSSNGSTLSADVVRDGLIHELIIRLNHLFQPLGPTNYQFRKEGETVYLLEVNPRISSSTSFRAAFCFNEAWMSIDYFLNGLIPTPETPNQGRAVRYVEDCIERI